MEQTSHHSNMSQMMGFITYNFAQTPNFFFKSKRTCNRCPHSIESHRCKKRPLKSPSMLSEQNKDSNDNQPKNNKNNLNIFKNGVTPTNPEEAKQKLLDVLAKLTNDEIQIGEVERQILNLESLNITPITDSFTEMGLEGSWDLLFSSTKVRSRSSIIIRKIGQIFDTENKKMINQTIWTFPSKNGNDQIEAKLSVECTYKFVGPGRLKISVDNHQVRILERSDGKKNDLPDDLQRLILDLQLSLPVEFFNPNGLMDISYMEPSFRLSRFLGKRVAGVRDVFIRSEEKVEPSSDT